ncbi:ketoreductase [Acephala macrosclerotiorum]|nr:ketoreductase [Acephala macrosclerotiorum]
MTRVLLTCGSDFIAAHILELLLKQGHSVVATVRSQKKTEQIKSVFSKYGKEQLDFTIVEDIARLDAFKNAVILNPPFEAIVRTASPFQFNVTDIQKVIIGTTNILKASKDGTPTVKIVVITSSFVAIYDPSRGNRPEYTYSETDFNPMTLEDALSHPAKGYIASKVFAEKSAWDFMEKEKPKFSLSAINPTLVFGRIIPGLHSLSSLNTSNQLILGITAGTAKTRIPDMGTLLGRRPRLAHTHVQAMSLPSAANQRFFTTANEQYNNKMTIEIIRKNFPEHKDVLPEEKVEGGRFPEGGVELGLRDRELEVTVVDTIHSFKVVGGQ